MSLFFATNYLDPRVHSRVSFQFLGFGFVSGGVGFPSFCNWLAGNCSRAPWRVALRTCDCCLNYFPKFGYGYTSSFLLLEIKKSFILRPKGTQMLISVRSYINNSILSWTSKLIVKFGLIIALIWLITWTR